jgi:hypothetical protein
VWLLHLYMILLLLVAATANLQGTDQSGQQQHIGLHAQAVCCALHPCIQWYSVQLLHGRGVSVGVLFELRSWCERSELRLRCRGALQGCSYCNPFACAGRCTCTPQSVLLVGCVLAPHTVKQGSLAPTALARHAGLPLCSFWSLCLFFACCEDGLLVLL